MLLSGQCETAVAVSTGGASDVLVVRRHRGEVTDRSDREIARDEALRRSLHVLGGDGVDPLAKRCRGLALSISVPGGNVA